MYATLLFDPTQLSLVSPVPLIVPTNNHQLHNHLPPKYGANTSLTVATCFDELADVTRQSMQARACQQLTLPPAFAQRQSLNGKFSLVAQAWQINVAGSRLCLRMVKIDGAKSNIINTWIFPADAQNLPVFAAELIGVGEAVRVAFVDVQAPVASARTIRLDQQLKSVASKFASLPCDEAAPDWATDASIGHYTYARQVCEQHLSAIRACYVDYLNLYLSYVSSVSAPSVLTAIDAASAALHAYQLHHMQHSPGKKFLGNLFGVDWTERFMLDFLFTLP